MNILVSACLLGVSCRYDGKSKGHPLATDRMQRSALIPFPRRIGGGRPPPGPRAERRGEGVFTGPAPGVRKASRGGAQEVLRLARFYGCTTAILKERSPACGAGEIYDGSFTHTLTEGYGVAAELLQENGIRVLGESELEDFLRGET